MIYEVINPSDAITFKADDEKVAVATVILLGEGQYGLRREDGKKDYPFLLFVKGKEQIDEQLKPYFDGIDDLFEYTKVHAKEMVSAFDSVVTANKSWRMEYETTLKFITEEKERQKYKDEFNDRHRSSLNNIYACAQIMKKRFEDLSRRNDALKLAKKYAVVISEYSAVFEDEKLIGWDSAKGSPNLLLFDDEDVADGHIQDLGESQDCDYKIEITRIGWVNFTLPA